MLAAIRLFRELARLQRKFGKQRVEQRGFPDRGLTRKAGDTVGERFFERVDAVASHGGGEERTKRAVVAQKFVRNLGLCRVHLVEHEKRLDLERLRLNQELVRKQKIRLGNARGEHDDEKIDVCNRRTQQRVCARQDIVQRSKAGLVEGDFDEVADHRRNALVAESAARFAGDGFAAIEQHGVESADSFDDSPYHAHQDAFAANVKSCRLTIAPSLKRTTSRVPSTSDVAVKEIGTFSPFSSVVSKRIR